MTTRNKKNKSKKSLVFSSLSIALGILLITVVLSLIGFESQKTMIVNNVLETSLILVNNIFSGAGIKTMLNNCISNFASFEPLILILISIIGISVAELSGLFKAICSKYRNIKFNKLIIFTMFISIISGVFGEYSFALVMPFMGVLYKNMGKNPLLGLLISFLGLTIGSGITMVFNYDNYLLGELTAAAARVEVDKNYNYNLLSTLYISLASLVIIILVGLVIINKILLPKFSKNYNIHEEMEEIIESRTGKKYSMIALIIMLILLVYEMIPGLPLSGLLLNMNEKDYIGQLFSYDSPFRNSLVLIVSVILIVCGYVYGIVSKNIKESKDFITSLNHIFDSFGLLFILSFIFAQLISVIEWTNIGEVISANLVNALTSMQLSGIPLILLFIIFVIISTFFMPALLDKWILFSPLIVPLFMRANIAPEFTQFIFCVSDGIGKSLTPLFGYFIVLIALLRRYNIKNTEFDAFSNFYKMILPIVVTFALLWLLIILGWYISGLPIGINGLATL